MMAPNLTMILKIPMVSIYALFWGFFLVIEDMGGEY